MTDHANRRDFIVSTTAAMGAGGFANLGLTNRAWADEETPNEAEIKAYLKPLLMTREQVRAWLAKTAYPFGKFDGELGYLHLDRDFKEGADGAICRYRYDKLDARRMIAQADKPCRINTYGNSFTACEQVSDGETWQEALASHLGEPLRNYGVGGYSVYQAYLRMRREEQRAPAKCIIFNIFDDDHYRNLHSWRRFKFGVNAISANGPVPFVEVDSEKDRLVERPNPCPTKESLNKLCDLEIAYETFKNDFTLLHRIKRAARLRAGRHTPPTDYDDREFTRLGVWATTRIVERVERYAKANHKRILYVLSYGGYTVKKFIERGFRFDQALVDFLDGIKVPYVDTMKAHADDYADFRCSIDEYLRRYYVGHYNPIGNHFQAFAIKDKLVALLDPKPAAYAKT